MEVKSHFISLKVVGWIDVFTCKEYACAMQNALRVWGQNGGPELQAYIILSNCVHLIARATPYKLVEYLQHFKQYTGREIIQLIHQNKDETRGEWLAHMLGYFGKYNEKNKHLQFWQCSDTCMELEEPEMIRRKIVYLHNLPVTQGIVSEPEHYAYSSASPLNGGVKAASSGTGNIPFYYKN